MDLKVQWNLPSARLEPAFDLISNLRSHSNAIRVQSGTPCSFDPFWMLPVLHTYLYEFVKLCYFWQRTTKQYKYRVFTSEATKFAILVYCNRILQQAIVKTNKGIVLRCFLRFVSSAIWILYWMCWYLITFQFEYRRNKNRVKTYYLPWQNECYYLWRVFILNEKCLIRKQVMWTKSKPTSSVPWTNTHCKATKLNIPIFMYECKITMSTIIF